MTPKERHDLVAALLTCPSISDRDHRKTIINDLSDDIKRNIERSNTDTFDVTNIITACLNYPDGLQELIEIIDFYEGDSIPLQNVKNRVADLQHDNPSIPQGSVPLQRPARAEHFINRVKDLEQLLTDLQSGKVVTLCGPGGIGKSALAAEAVWQLPLERFPDGIIFHSFYSQPDPALAFETIIRAFGAEAKPSPKEAAHRVLANKQTLLILDGTEDAHDLQAVLAVRGHQCGVLVTSRQRKDALVSPQDVKPLDLKEATELLRVWGGDRIKDTAKAESICKLVGGLPLALRLVGRYLDQTGETAAEYLEWLETTPIRALTQGKHKKDSAEVLLERSLKQVSPEVGQVLAVVGQLALAPFRVEPLAEAIEFEIRETRHLLGELVSYGLLMRGDAGYEVSHALVHTYASRRLRVTAEVGNRLARYYTAFAETASEKGPEGYHRLDGERGHMMKVLVGCVERKDWDSVQDLVWAVDGYLSLQGYWTERVITLEQGIKAAQEVANRYNEGAFLGDLGGAYYNLGQVKKAMRYYEQALTINREIGNRQGEGSDLGNLGSVYSILGQMEKAIGYYEQALTISREIDDRWGEGVWLSGLGVTYNSQGQVKMAIEYQEQALTISREIGDRQNEGVCLGSLGAVYHDLGQVEKAIDYFEQALTISREIGSRQGEGDNLGGLGAVYHVLGQVEKAIGYYEQALTISREIGNRWGEGSNLGNLGGAYYVLGQVEKAIGYYEQALTISQEIRSRYEEGGNLNNLGTIYNDGLGQFEESIKYYQQSLTISREIGDRRNEGLVLGNIGETYVMLKQPQKSLDYIQQGLQIARETGTRLYEGYSLYKLGLAYRALGQNDVAQQYLKQSLAILEEVKSPDAEKSRKLLAELDEE